MNIKIRLFSVIVLAVAVLIGCSEADFVEIESTVSAYSQESDSKSNTSDESKITVPADGTIKINYIDVGQADSILIQTSDNKNMLIDAGETKEHSVRNYIDSMGIRKFDIVVATHPHADHISDMADIIDNYEIDTFYMPGAVHTSKTFEKMIDALEKNNVNTVEAKEGISDTLGNWVQLDFLAPAKEYDDDLNNWSAVIMLTYGNNKFLFMGDAESDSEKDILSKGTNISANVLKVGHHGSSTSTTEEFLDKVNPEIAVISCGQDNKYGHPHKETIQKLNERNIAYYITKDAGTIIVESDGTNYKVVSS